MDAILEEGFNDQRVYLEVDHDTYSDLGKQDDQEESEKLQENN